MLTLTAKLETVCNNQITLSIEQVGAEPRMDLSWDSTGIYFYESELRAMLNHIETFKAAQEIVAKNGQA